MSSPEIRTGTRVRVIGPMYPDLVGEFGTITNSYGHPDYLAFEVQLGDGRKILLWHHQLAKVEKD